MLYLWDRILDIWETVEYLLLLITNRNSYTGFPLIPKIPILNVVMAVILRYFTEFRNSGANYVKVFEDRPILSARRI